MTHSASRVESLTIELLGVLPIRIYQRTIGQVLPDSCRFSPTCSQYGVTAIRRFGLQKGLALTASRIGRCRRPNRGFDPVPQVYMATSRGKGARPSVVKQEDAQPIKGPVKGNYQIVYRLIFAIPQKGQELSKETLDERMKSFKEEVVNNQYAIRYDIHLFEVGVAREHYVFRVAGTVHSDIANGDYHAFEQLFADQLDIFLDVKEDRSRVVYAEYDGRVTTQPAPDEPLASEYNRNSSFWDYTYSSNRSFWDDYWSAYFISEAVEGGCDLLEGCDGCELPDLDGCDGCDFDGCDLGGCDLDGCDASGCDTSGCDMSARLGMVSSLTRRILRG